MQKNNEITTQNTTQEEQNIATGVLHQIKRSSWAWLIFAGVAYIALAALFAQQACLNQRNNERWMELFSSYDYVSQDGEGINNVNTGTQGDLNNIPDAE